jgi:class 3 adenylate cyclase
LLEDLAEELVAVQRVATRDGDVLTYIGEGANRASRPGLRDAAAIARTERGAGERRQLTVMFCDLVGSTELAQRVDPEELGEVLHAYRTTCAEATKRVGGHVAQFLGDGVLVYFGFPQAHEDAAARAIRAALEIQRVLATRSGSERIEARIGIHTGLVVVNTGGASGEPLALGPTTNLAARIEGFAAPGKVVVSDATLALCRERFIAKSLGDVELKGIREPVRLHEVEATAGVRSGLEIASLRPIVGRDREVGLLRYRWSEAIEGRGHVVLVSGEAGMGKSRLVQRLHDDLEGTPHLWLDMQCSPFSSGTAFQPVVDLLTAGLALGEAASPAEASESLVTGLESVAGIENAEVIPYLIALLSLPRSERYPMFEMSAKEQRERTFGALVQLTLKLAAVRPVVLVAEDMHWCDPSTLEYLGRLVDQAATAPLMLVLTSRPEFRAPWTQSHVSEIKLARLSKSATREMIQDTAGGLLPEVVLSELELRSDGVPLFANELTTNVVSSGVLLERAGRFELRGSFKELAIPATLQDSLMARLDRLSASKQVAQQAATLGREFSYDLIEAVTDLNVASLRNALAQLVAAEILHQRGVLPQANFTFRHALLQDTAYESQLYSTRKTLHAKIAEVLAERFPARVASEPEFMARHCAAAGLMEKAVDHYQRAAELAVARLSNQEAAEHYGLALEALASLVEDDNRRQREIAIRLAQATALMGLGGYESPEVVANIARVEELGRIVGEGPQQLPALLGLVQFDIHRGDNMNSRGRAEAIIRIAEPLGVKQLTAAAHYIIGGTELIVGSSFAARDRLAQTIAIAEAADFPPPATPNDIDLVAMAHVTHALALVSCGEPERAVEAIRVGRKRAAEFGNDQSVVQCAAMAATTGYLLDDPEMTRSAAGDSLAFGAGRGFHTAQLMATVTHGWARARLGEIEAGVRDVDHGLEIADAMGSIAGVALLCVAAAEAHWLAGDRKRAEALLDRATETVERRRETIGYSSRVLIGRAQLALAFGDEDPAGVEALLLAAMENADRGELVWDGIVAATPLARLAPRTGKVREAHERLSNLYGRLANGHDRAPIVAAKTAIDELARML